MSYTTRCPACGTTFRVVPDQLKISDGWVRCGHCADVFDATLYLEQWTPAPTLAPTPTPQHTPSPLAAPAQEPAPTVAEPAASEAARPVPDSASVASGFDATAPADLAPDGLLGTPQEEAPPVAAEPAVSSTSGVSKPGDAEPAPDTEPLTDAAAPSDPPAPPATAPAEDDFQAELVRFAARQPTDAEAPAAEPPDIPSPPPVAALPEGLAAPVPSPAADEPGFVRQARRQAFWRSPLMRAMLSLLLVLLLALLAVQWAVQDRDRLASRHPALAPLLVQLCEPLGCRIAPPRQIDAVVIESTALVRRLGNFYAFDVVLKNTATMAVAMPALELSLTDTQDRVIARRVFLPRELPGAPEQLAPESSLPLNLRLSVADAASGALPMAGYRALVFYP